MKHWLSAIATGLLLLNTAADAAAPASAWPANAVAAFVFDHLDLASFRNSTGPRRGAGQRLFADLGIKLTQSTEVTATADNEEWTYSIQILGRRDYNKDGIEEIAICFVDRAKQGTYNIQQPLLLQLLDERAVAIAYDISTDTDAARCRDQ